MLRTTHWVALFWFTRPSAGRSSLMYVNKEPPGPPPCNKSCSSRLPRVDANAEAHLQNVFHFAYGQPISTDVNFTSSPRWSQALVPNAITMIPPVGLQNFRSAIERVVADNVLGDVVELGVWRGGACVFAKAVLNTYGQAGREVHLFDVFDSMKLLGYASSQEFGAKPNNSIDAIRASFEAQELMDTHVHFHEGLFNETTAAFRKHHSMKSIAVLRVDGNFYTSYQDSLYNLYELVPVGGIVILDDVLSHTSIIEFWNDFTADYDMHEHVHKVPGQEAIGWFRKEKHVAIDWERYRGKERGKSMRMFDVVHDRVGR